MRFWIRLISIVAVVAVIFGYNTVLAVREKDDQIAKLTAEVESAKIAIGDDGSASGSYGDGTFSGEAQGFGGIVAVDVTVEGGKITQITITSAEKEDGAYLTMAEEIIPAIIEAQSADVDTISGATFSSTGIRDAVAQALEQSAASAPAGGSGSYNDGTYSGEAQGFGGTVAVDVTVEGGQITQVTITSAEKEDGAYLTMAEDIIPAIIEAQSADVDTISGATFSSTGIKNAVAQALEKAAE